MREPPFVLATAATALFAVAVISPPATAGAPPSFTTSEKCAEIWVSPPLMDELSYEPLAIYDLVSTAGQLGIATPRSTEDLPGNPPLVYVVSDLSPGTTVELTVTPRPGFEDQVTPTTFEATTKPPEDCQPVAAELVDAGQDGVLIVSAPSPVRLISAAGRRLSAPIGLATTSLGSTRIVETPVAGPLVLDVGGTRIDVPASPEDLVIRLSGEDRFETAALVSEFRGQTGGTVAVVSGEDFPDAIAAGSVYDNVLLTARDSLPDATARELTRIQPEQIVIVGGTAVVSPTVEGELAAHAATVRRVAGTDRFATAVEVAVEGELTRSIPRVVSGEDFPDALSASIGHRQRILLTRRDTLPASTRDALLELRPFFITVVGGKAAVSDAVQEELESIAAVRRIAGEDRTLTALALALDTDVVLQLFSERGLPDAGSLVVVRGDDFADAISAGTLGLPLIPSSGDEMGGPGIEGFYSVFHCNIAAIVLVGGASVLPHPRPAGAGCPFGATGRALEDARQLQVGYRNIAGQLGLPLEPISLDVLMGMGVGPGEVALSQQAPMSAMSLMFGGDVTVVAADEDGDRIPDGPVRVTVPQTDPHCSSTIDWMPTGDLEAVTTCA